MSARKPSERRRDTSPERASKFGTALTNRGQSHSELSVRKAKLQQSTGQTERHSGEALDPRGLGWGEENPAGAVGGVVEKGGDRACMKVERAVQQVLAEGQQRVVDCKQIPQVHQLCTL